MLRKSEIEITRKEGYCEYIVEPLKDRNINDRRSDQMEDFNEIQSFIRGDSDHAKGKVNWVGSGSCVVLQTKNGLYIPVGYRDEDAPTHSNKLCTASGIADTMSEISNPRLLTVKELEEILIYDQLSKCWRKPVFENEELLNGRRSPSLTNVIDNLSFEMNDSSTRAYRQAEAEFHAIGNDKIQVKNTFLKQYENSFEGFIVLDEKTGNADLVDVVTIDVTDRRIEDLTIVDGEMAGGSHLDRPVYLFEPTEFYDLFNGEAEALRRYRSGKVYSNNNSGSSDSSDSSDSSSSDTSNYVSDFNKGDTVKRSFDAVPTLHKSHERIVKKIRDLSS